MGVRSHYPPRAVGLLLGVAAVALCASPAFADAAKRAAPPGFLGVCAANAAPGDFEQMVDARVGVVRTLFSLRAVRREPGDEYDWSAFDEQVEAAARNGIDFVPILYGVPRWVSEERSATPLDSPAAKRGWRDFLTELVGRYGREGEFWEQTSAPRRPLKIWQVWNEPNSRTWWGPRPNPREYGKLLKLSAGTIRGVDPKAEIMTAGIVAEPTNARAIKGARFIRSLMKQRSVRRAVDAVAFHPYAKNVDGVRRQLGEARRAMNRSKLRRTPIWVTEIGWGSVGPKDHFLIKPEPAQARVLKAAFRMIVSKRKRLGIDRALWYHWRERPSDLCLWCETSGLLTEDGQRKPLFGAFRSVARR